MRLLQVGFVRFRGAPFHVHLWWCGHRTYLPGKVKACLPSSPDESIRVQPGRETKVFRTLLPLQNIGTVDEGHVWVSLIGARGRVPEIARIWCSGVPYRPHSFARLLWSPIVRRLVMLGRFVHARVPKRS